MVANGATEGGVKTVSVAYFYDDSYFGSVYDSPEKEGFGYEYLQAIGNYSGWKYRYIYGDYDSLFEQFMQGRIDIMPAVPSNFNSEEYYTKLINETADESKKAEIKQNRIQVLYPNQPMNSVDYYFCIPGNLDGDDFMISEYYGANIGIPSVIEGYAEEWISTLGLHCKLHVFDNTAACINALNDGRVDAIISENKVANAGLIVCRKMGAIDYYLGVSSRNRGLVKDINLSLDAISSSTYGYLNSLKSSYNSLGELESRLGSSEKKWVESHNELKVGTIRDFPPYSYTDAKTGEGKGFIHGAIEDILFKLSVDIDVSYNYYDSYGAMVDALKAGEVDVIFPVPVYLYVSEQNDYMNTNSIAQSDMVVVYKSDFSEGVFATIASPKSGVEGFYDKHTYTSSTIIEYNTVEECLEALRSDSADCTVLSDYLVDEYVRNNNNYRKYNCVTLPDKMELCLGVRKEDTGLYNLLIRGIAITQRGNDLQDRYIEAASDSKQLLNKGIRDMLTPEVIVLMIVIFVLIVLVILIATWANGIQRASKHLKAANKEIIGIAQHQQQNFDVIGILARDYSSVYKVDIATEEVQTFRLEDTAESAYSDMLRLGARFSEVFSQYVRDCVYEDDKPKMYDELSIPMICRKLKARSSYSIRYRKHTADNEIRYFEYRVSIADIDERGNVLSVVVAFIDCNDEIIHETEYMKSLEKALKSDAVITGLTGDFDWVAYVANTEGKDGGTVTTYRTSESFKKRFANWDEENDFNRMIEILANEYVYPDDHKMFIRSTGKNHIRRHLMKETAYYVNFRIIDNGELMYYQLKFVADIADGKLFGFILGIHGVDDEIRREKEQQEKLENMVEERTAQLEEKNIALNRMNNDIIELMGNIVEGRDAESGQHVRRVKDFTNILASEVMRTHPEYGLNRNLVDIITSASALHDVGKITISDSILLKPGRLTNEEYDLMKTHTVNGCAILDKMPADWDEQYMKISMEICRHHHEKYDGKGYPDGLSGDDIPISAQIVSVADCYDALVSKRVYKDAYSCDEAYDMIRRGECGMFNPKLMECFEACKDEFARQVETTGNGK